jgi:hypothetical protein
MIGFAVLTVVSLLLMWWRLRRRGRFGRTASAVLRSVYPLILGLGGWFLGVLIVLTTSSTIPIEDQLLAVVSIGVPIGLGIYLAWVNRDRQSNANTIGFAVAVGGGLVGAWLGFNAASGLISLITAIVGATVGANLILLALDISWDRQARDRVEEATVAEAMAGDPHRRRRLAIPRRHGESVISPCPSGISDPSLPARTSP